MEKGKLKTSTLSAVGPLSDVEDWADKFISGIVYCSLLKKLVEQQHIVDAILSTKESGTPEFDEAKSDAEGLEKVWVTLGSELGYEC